MHVLYFHQHFSTPDGAAATRSYEMAQALLRSGHTVTMVCGSYAQGSTGLVAPFRNGSRRGTVASIDIIEFDLAYGNHMGFAKRLWAFAKFAIGSTKLAMLEPCDVVFATSTPLTAGIPGIFSRLFRRKPFVFEVRDLWPELPQAMGVINNTFLLWLMSVLEWVSYHMADRLIGLSPGIVEGIMRRGVDKSRIALVPNGCDLELFPAQKFWRPSEVQNDQLLAVFTGTHGPANALHAVLDAAAVLQSRGRRDIIIALVGQGRDKLELQKRADEEAICNVIFLEPVPKMRLAGLLAGANIGLQVLRNVPAFYDGTSPNKFFDYIAAGIPVLNNYPGWLANMIKQYDCGYVVPPDDPNAFADALISAAENRSTLLLKGQQARRLAEQEFARKDLSKKWVAWVTGSKESCQRFKQ